jgi:hypothetical protein
VPEVVGNVSNAAKSLCMWVCAMEVYARIFKVGLVRQIALLCGWVGVGGGGGTGAARTVYERRAG